MPLTLTEQIIQRARRREPWQVERTGANRFQVRCPIHEVLAEDLTREEAQQLAESFNAARSDAAALAEYLR